MNHQHVVTAGHCIKNKNIEDLTVTLGEYNIAESRDYEEFYPSQTYKVRAMVARSQGVYRPSATCSLHHRCSCSYGRDLPTSLRGVTTACH